MIKRLQIKISGSVQGVGFRYCAHLAFTDLQVKGQAQNLPEGGVLIEAQGEEDKLERLLNWCRKGPEGARVNSVEISELPVLTDEEWEKIKKY